MNKVFKCALTGFLFSNAAYASDFQYSGYMRTGIGYSLGGTDQVCFDLQFRPKDRLGNECDTYIETAFTKIHRLGDESSPSFSTNIRLALLGGGDMDWGENTDTKRLNISLSEAFVKSENLFSKGGADLWIGKRFYRRHDVHMLDYYFLDNSGPGTGVENINAGFAKAHVALLRSVPSVSGGQKDLAKLKNEKIEEDAPTQTNLDFRLSDIKVGSGDLGLAYIHSTTSTRGHQSGEEKWEGLSGNHLTVMYQMNMLGGFNQTVLQYGQGVTFKNDSKIAKGTDTATKAQAKTELDAKKKSNKTTIINHTVAEFNKQINMSMVALYATSNSGQEKAKNRDEMMFAVRPSYALTDTTALTMSYSFNQISNYAEVKVDGKDKAIDGTLHKITFAPEMSLNTGVWTRPKLRLFGTYAMWNKELKDHGIMAQGTTYANDTAGFSTGAQVEVWW